MANMNMQAQRHYKKIKDESEIVQRKCWLVPDYMLPGPQALIKNYFIHNNYYLML